MTQKETTEEACRLQSALCGREGVPHFAPHDGFCYDCHKNIYQVIEHNNGTYNWKTGIDLASAGTSHITACPHCSSSYCD
jgi:hypothetical protein